MKRKAKSSTPEIPLTSTSDVAFLLLIFFLVAASNTADKGRGFDLPSTVKSAQQKEGQNLEITIKPGPRNQFGDAIGPDIITLAGETLGNNADLPALLRQKLEGKTDPQQRVVMITTDESIDYQSWSDVISAVELAGAIPAPQIPEEDEDGGGGQQ